MALIGYLSPLLTYYMLSATILEKKSFSAPMILLLILVLAQLIRHSFPKSETLALKLF